MLMTWLCEIHVTLAFNLINNKLINLTSTYCRLSRYILCFYSITFDYYNS
ncbi:hypothetical protein HanPSC8_Chr03g0089321 [Helianthus annuus]|nr:hypothetical protein HanPSC8_Chr03g0089321 [Helianthus annuus]